MVGSRKTCWGELLELLQIKIMLVAPFDLKENVVYVRHMNMFVYTHVCRAEKTSQKNALIVLQGNCGGNANTTQNVPPRNMHCV